MIYTRFLAALLMLNTSAGNRPAPASQFLNPRRADCAAPLTVNAAVCSGNDVGIPPLRWCVCQLVSGRYGTWASVTGEFQGMTMLYAGAWAPVSVSNIPTIWGLSHVWPSGSGRFFGKSYVRTPRETPGAAG